MGTNEELPKILSQPEIPENSTPFLEGIKDGIDAVPKRRNYVEKRPCRHPDGNSGCFLDKLTELIT